MAHLTWYIIRAAGIVAYLLLFATVATGLRLSGPGGARWRGISVLTLHRALTWLMGALVLVHVAVLLVDTYLRFNLVQILIPFTADYEPFWTGLGVLALYLLLFVLVSTAIRRDLHNLLWYGLHLLSYPAFVLATAHGIKDGADTRTFWMVALYVAAAATSGYLLALRFTRLATASQGQLQRWGPGAVAGSAFGVMVLVLLGTRLH